MPDFLSLEWHEVDELTQEDDEDWLLAQAAFVTKCKDPAVGKGKAKAKAKLQLRRPRAGETAVGKERRTSAAAARALDNALRLVDLREGKGLAEFLPACGEGQPFVTRPLLVCHFDECSVNLAWCNWMMYSQGLRLIGIRDIYHREWNDTQLALKASGLWSLVLLTTVAFNFVYGPWNGSKFFSELQEACQDFAKRTNCSSPLFEVLYSEIAAEQGLRATGSLAQKQKVLTALPKSRGLRTRGPRVAMRRWFSWIEAATWHSECWWSRVLILAYAGVRSGLFHSLDDCPLLQDGQVPTSAPPDASDEAKAVASAAHTVASASASSAAAPPEATAATSDERLVKGKTKEEQELRRECKNTMYVALAIMCRPGVRDKVNMVVAFSAPFASKHSEHTITAKTPEGSKEYYLQQCHFAWAKPMVEVARKLQDLTTLRLMGMTDTFGHLKGAMSESTSRQVSLEDELAQTSLRFVCHLLRSRGGSMMVHRNWPLLLALFISDSDEVKQEGLRLLRQHWADFQAVKLFAGASRVVATMVGRSPFQCTFAREAAEVAAGGGAEGWVLWQLSTVARQIFSGFGQTKVVEDGIGKVRDHEDFDVKNKKVSLRAQWSSLREEKVLEMHGRREVTVLQEDEAPASEPVTWDSCMHHSNKHECSLGLRPLVGKATWPTLTAQSCQALPLEMCLFRHCVRADDIGALESHWKCAFVDSCTVLREVSTDKHCLALGHVGFATQLQWPLLVRSHADQQLCELDTGPNTRPEPLPILNFSDWQIVPSEAVSPSRRFLLGGCKLQTSMGLCLHLMGAPRDIHKYAAEHAFFDIAKPILDKLAAEEGLPKAATLYAQVEQLLAKLLPDKSPEQLQEILRQRGLRAKPYLLPEEISEELVEEMCDPDTAKAVKD